jgi:hypothetical protein
MNLFDELDALNKAASTPTTSAIVPAATPSASATSAPVAASAADIGGQLFGLYAEQYRDKLKTAMEKKRQYLGREYFIAFGFGGEDEMQGVVARTKVNKPGLDDVIASAKNALNAVTESGEASDGPAILAEIAKVVTDDARYHLSAVFVDKDGKVRPSVSAFSDNEVIILILHGIPRLEAGGVSINSILPVKGAAIAEENADDAF